MAQVTWNSVQGRFGRFECGDAVFDMGEIFSEENHGSKRAGMRHFQVSMDDWFDVDRVDHFEFQEFRCDFWAKDFEDAKRKAMKVIEMWME